MDIEGFEKLLDIYESRINEVDVALLSRIVPTEEWEVSKSAEGVDIMSLRDVPWTDRRDKLRDMIGKMRVFLEEGKDEKFYRWLGFVQCGLWMLELYSVDELRQHNRGIC